ncbi:mis18-binding protein 1 [Sebastes fasciatus]|uniref:mis18-binding protein 1 n=1 Tax=Sebastes fasciatus TaxID=394691 RepID=UPI003D9F307F
MEYYHHLLQDTKPPFESPAKVFALLKSKVKKEGTFTANDSSCDVTDNHGAVVVSPRKKTAQSTWRTDKENHRSASHQASNLSPQKTFRYPDISSKHVEEMPPPPVPGHGYYTPRKRAFLESTALSHLSSPINRPHIHTPQIRDSCGRFKAISRTPVKTQPVENDFVSGVFEEVCAPQDKQVSHAYVLSPMRKRLKKSTWEMQEFNTVSSSTNEVNNESIGQPQEKKTSSAFTEDNITCMDSHLGNVRGFPGYLSGMTFTHEPVFPSPRPNAMKRCHVSLDRLPQSSPAKIFAYMKERESKTKQQEVHKVSRSTKDLFDEGNFHQSRDTPPPSTAHNMGEMEDIACRSLVPVDRSRVESAESSQSDTYPSEDVPSPALSPQPVLLEDSLILKTPRISIPKKQEAVFKRNKLPTSTKFPYESTIYLKKWFLRKNNRGLFVDGIHRDDNIPWNSNIIVERVSNSVVKTVSGSVYILIGKMNMTESELPKWLLKMFAHGFPRDWKALYERLLSRQETERNNKGRSLEASSMIRSVKPRKKTPASCPPASLSRLNVSRSGRVIKPPLEYWRGGRVILDAQMNVTIHECYDTSIYTPVTRKASQKPARVFLPCSEGRKQSESASNEEASVPLRRVKAPLRKRNSAEPEEKPHYSPEPSVETLGRPEEWSDRPTRSSRRRPAAERALYVDTVPQMQSEPEKSSTRRSKRQTHNTARPSVRVLGSKRAVPASASSSDDGVIGRKTPGKEVHRKRSGRVLDESQPSYVFPSSSEQSESDSDEEESGPLRRVKAPLRKLNSAMVKPEEKPSCSSEPFVERLSSPEEWSDRPTRSNRRRPAAERALYVDTVPQKQSEPEKSSTRRSKRQTHTNTRPSVRVLGSKRAVRASASSDDGVIGRKTPGKEVHRKKSGRVLNESRPCYVFPSSESSQSSDEFEKELGKKTRITRQSKCIKSSSSSSSSTKPLPKFTQSSKKKNNAHEGNAPIPQEQDADEWTEAELMKLQEAVSYYPNHMAGYWAKVAEMVGRRSAEECHYQHTSKVTFNTPAKRAKKPQKEKVEAPKVQDLPVISSGVGTYKRKQQVRQFLEAMPREDVEDVFSSAYMQNKRFEMPSMCPSDHDFTTSEMEHLSPMSTGCAGAKTPQCLHLTPGMMGSPNRNNGDKYVYQLQKRMKKNQFNVCKQAPPSKSFTPTPSVKRTMRRCGNTENDTFFVWEMFPGKDGALSESGEEEDFYFSDND